MNRYFFGVGDGVGEDAGGAAGVGDEVAAPAGLLSGAAPAGGGFLSLIDTNSTSKISVELGPIGPPGVPRAP
jgi:hypothetical protein